MCSLKSNIYQNYVIVQMINLTISRIGIRVKKLSLNLLKTHYIIFTPKNKIVDGIDIKINNTSIERVYDTKFLRVHIESQLSWKSRLFIHKCKKLSKCVAIISNYAV